MATEKKNTSTAAPAEKSVKAAVSYIVIQPFQDADEHRSSKEPKQYAVGDDVSHFDLTRLAAALDRGLVEIKK